jgi:hypothetical protein
VGSTVGAGVSVGSAVGAGVSFLPQLQRISRQRQSKQNIIRFIFAPPFSDYTTKSDESIGQDQKTKN